MSNNISSNLDILPLDWNDSISIDYILDKIDEIYNEIEINKEYIFFKDINESDSHKIIEQIKLNHLCLSYSDGKLMIRKCSRSIAHEVASREIYFQLRRNLTNMVSIGQAACYIGKTIKEPDESFVPLDRNTSGPYAKQNTKLEFPTVVVKVTEIKEECTEETFLDELKSWLSDLTTVMVAIGVKLYLKETLEIMFYLCIRNNKDYTIVRDLSEGKEYQDDTYYCVEVPLESIYDGVQIPDELQSMKSVKLDLMSLKKQIIMVKKT